MKFGVARKLVLLIIFIACVSSMKAQTTDSVKNDLPINESLPLSKKKY